jgi:hypothetical protein
MIIKANIDQNMSTSSDEASENTFSNILPSPFSQECMSSD